MLTMDALLFVALPYVATFLAVVVGISRYRSRRFTYSSLSSQFLEDERLFSGSVPWHYGILTILTAHLLGFLCPRLWTALLGSTARLYFLEVTGIALAAWTLYGLAMLMIRRGTNARIRAVSTAMDWVLLADLLLQVGLGITVAVTYRWGSRWYLATAVPWLWSLVRFQPTVATISSLPLLVKLHMANAFVLLGLFPFTRLVHVVTWPVGYLWRPHQVVVWNRREVRRTNSH